VKTKIIGGRPSAVQDAFLISQWVFVFSGFGLLLVSMKNMMAGFAFAWYLSRLLEAFPLPSVFMHGAVKIGRSSLNL